MRMFALGIPAVVLGAVAAGVALSPYRGHPQHDDRALREGVEIDASCGRVFQYLGNSANASRWSVFVDHIIPLNVDSVSDGEVGSIRRSFRNADETGMRWDELFTDVEPAKRRRLLIYNIVHAPIPTNEMLVSEQHYESMGPQGCRLTFTLSFANEPRIGEVVKMHIASYMVARIFRRNLANIKRLSEEHAVT